MEWLLIMFLVSPMGNIEFDPLPFASEAECRAEAAALIEVKPVFEWWEPPAGEAAQLPADRSYVTCIPAADRQQ